MKNINEMSNPAIVKRHEALGNRISKLIPKICDNGFGGLKFNELVCLENKPKYIVNYINLVNESSLLRYEAEMRYGPGLITIRQLIYK